MCPHGLYIDKPPCRRLVATKLRLFAQTTSPRTNTQDSPSPTQTLPAPNPSSPLQTLPAPTNPPAPTSPLHNHKLPPPTTDPPPPPTHSLPTDDPQPPTTSEAPPVTITENKPIVTVKKKRGRPPLPKTARLTALSSFATKKRALSRSPTPPPVENNVKPSSRDTSVEDCQGLPAAISGVATNASTSSVQEDDIASVTSNSTNSSGQRSSLRVNRRTRATSEKEKKAPFHFNDLFGFSDPPKLVVRDGELVPEHSQSVMNLDRLAISQLPSNHSFLNWALGKPVSGKSSEANTKGGRKRKAVS